MWSVVPIGSRVYLAVDAGGVTCAELGEGLGRSRLRTIAHEPLAAGVLAPGAAGPNLQDTEAVRGAIARALGRMSRSRVTLVLPDGIARLALFEPPRGVAPREYVRYRLESSLPWPAADAGFDALDVGHGRVVGAAVRRATVAEYEQAVAAVGAGVEQVHLAPLLATAALLRARDKQAAHAVLGDVAMCLALLRDGALVALRSRRRDRSPGEAARLLDELCRLAAAAAGGNGGVAFVVSGTGAASLRQELGAGVREAAAPKAPSHPEIEAGWLEALLA